MTIRSELLAEIAEYIAAHPMSETTFGICAVNDGKLVSRVRAGYNVTVRTVDRTRQFLRGEVGPSGIDPALLPPKEPKAPPKIKRVRRKPEHAALFEQPSETAKAA